ncbi:MAG: flippase-like domain-containing protein [Methanomicrobiales archaeon]|nr:flippase-like domain-containing protein [Methanomicrobiales archaeon]
MKRTQWKWLAVSIGFSVVVLALVLYFTIDESTLEYLSRLDPVFLFLGLVVHMAALCFWGLRIQFMAGSLGYRVRFRHCLNMVLANMLVAAITPSQAGGEPVRIHELYRSHVKIGDATAIVIMERVLDGVILGSIGAVAMLLLSTYWQSIELNVATPMFISWIIVCTFLIVFGYSVRNPELLKQFLHRSSAWIARRWKSRHVDHFVDAIDREVDNFHGSLVTFVGRGKAGLVWGMLFTTLFWCCEFVIASLILMGLGEKPYLIESFIVQLIIAILMMIPLTPGGSGIAELGATSLYSIFVPSSIVGIFVVLWRLILFYVNIVVGLLASIYIVRRELILRTIGLKKK